MHFTFKTMPLTTNRLYGYNGSRRYLRPEGKENKEAIGWEALAQFHGKLLTEPLSVMIHFYWPTQRNHDIDNIKGFLDALSGIVWEDDGQIVELLITKAVDKENPRVEMVVVCI